MEYTVLQKPEKLPGLSVHAKNEQGLPTLQDSGRRR